MARMMKDMEDEGEEEGCNCGSSSCKKCGGSVKSKYADGGRVRTAASPKASKKGTMVRNTATMNKPVPKPKTLPHTTPASSPAFKNGGKVKGMSRSKSRMF